MRLDMAHKAMRFLMKPNTQTPGWRGGASGQAFTQPGYLKAILSHALAALLLCASSLRGVAQELPAYRIYDERGREVDFGVMATQLQKQDIILFGEQHNDPICHWLQLELAKKLSASDKPLVMGAEMFETDDQVVLNEYLAGTITLDHLKKEAKVWPNFDTDYMPLTELAREKGIPFIATNVPRRYASLVARKGPGALDSLNTAAKSFIGALPYIVTENDSGYAEMRRQMGFHGGGMNVDWLIAAQALKDHTMAENILKHHREGAVFLHFNGTFHSQKHSGICHYLEKENAGLKIGVIAAVEGDPMEFDKKWGMLGDYIIVVPPGMCKTH